MRFDVFWLVLTFAKNEMERIARGVLSPRSCSVRLFSLFSDWVKCPKKKWKKHVWRLDRDFTFGGGAPNRVLSSDSWPLWTVDQLFGRVPLQWSPLVGDFTLGARPSPTATPSRPLAGSGLLGRPARAGAAWLYPSFFSPSNDVASGQVEKIFGVEKWVGVWKKHDLPFITF